MTDVLAKVDLCGGDWVIGTRGESTILYAIGPNVPKTRKMFKFPRDYRNWGKVEWERARKIVKKDTELASELTQLEKRLEKRRRFVIAQIELLDGGFLLEFHGPRTILLDTAGKKMVSGQGQYVNWDPETWQKFLSHVKGSFDNKQLDAELWEVADDFRQRWIKHEIPLIDDDIPSPPNLWGIHSLYVNYSKKLNYIKISGTTFSIRGELKGLELNWNPKLKTWSTPFNRHTLKSVRTLVKKHDKITDPVSDGLVRCHTCRTWVPEGNARQRGPTHTEEGEWYCGCLHRLKAERAKDLNLD